MDALFYPFHLCHERTLERLLQDYAHIHFRDLMALQLTPLTGITAFSDRMGDYYPDLVNSGKIVQGHNVSGPLSPAITTAANRDLADPRWRSLFHEALRQDRQFQRGLVTFAQDSQGRSSVAADPASLSSLQQPEREFTHYTVEALQSMTRRRMSDHTHFEFEYGFGLLKTSAALQYTIQLCRQLELAAVTDSAAHHQLLEQTCQRDAINLSTQCVKRKGY